MTLYEYHRGHGFKEILNFMWNAPGGPDESEEVIFDRLEYKYDSYLFCEKDLFWLKIYRNNGDNEHEYLISVHNRYCVQYIACRTFIDYLEFMRYHLSVIQQMNDLGTSV